MNPQHFDPGKMIEGLRAVSLPQRGLLFVVVMRGTSQTRVDYTMEDYLPKLAGWSGSLYDIRAIARILREVAADLERGASHNEELFPPRHGEEF